MPYSSFSLQSAVDQFSLDYQGRASTFPADLPNLPKNADVPLGFLAQQLDRDIDLARRTYTEKAKSEFVIAPVLATLRQIQRVGVHSGVAFDVSAAEDLRGACDFLITLSDEIEIIRSPILVVVEAKRSIIAEGLGQCVAEMVAAQRFNKSAGALPAPIFGCVTNGFSWRFLRLTDQTVTGDDAIEHPLMPLSQLMQRLCYTVTPLQARS